MRGLRGLVVVDEVQRHPDLFPLLRVLADRKPLPARFLVLGSASGDLMRQGSESLAGRIRFHELPGFSLDEVDGKSWERLWHRGGFPKSYLAPREPDSYAWREAFIETFLERDIPNLGLRLPAPQLRRFWTTAAHYHGQTWNSAEIGRSLGLSDKTMLHHLQVLEQTFMVRLLPAWHGNINIGKRLVKAPKFYVRDAGLLHALLGLRDRKALLLHPKLGASWVGDPWGSGAGPVDPQGRRRYRVRIQIRAGARDDEVRAPGRVGPEAAPLGRRPSGDAELSLGGAGGSRPSHGDRSLVATAFPPLNRRAGLTGARE